MVVYTEYCQKKPQKNYPVLKSNKCRHELERDSVLKSQTCSQKTRYYQVSTAVFTDHLWTNHPRWMLLPGVNRPNIQEKALTQHINMVRQMKGTHMSWRGQQQAKTQWSQSKQTGARRLREIGKRERQSARVTDEADVHKPEKTSDQANFKAVLSLFTWRSRFLDAKDQLILWFVSYILRGEEEEERHQPKRKKRC